VIWLQQFLNGLFMGSLYSLIALGYTMVYGVLKLINFAHGDIFMAGAFIGFFVLSAVNLPPLWALALALLAAMAGCALLGVVIERCAYRPLRTAHRADLVLAVGVWLCLIGYAILRVVELPTGAALVAAASMSVCWCLALGWLTKAPLPPFSRLAARTAAVAGVFAGVGVGVLRVYQLPWASTLTLSLLAAAAWVGLVGLVLKRSPEPAPRLAALITAIGVSFFLENMGILQLGAEPRSCPQVISSDPLPFLQERYDLAVNPQQLVIFLVSILLMALLHCLVHRTQIGRAMRAVSYDREVAQLMGINVDYVVAVTFALGSAAAAAAGVLYGMLYNVEPLMGIMPGLKAFVAAVLGGIGSLTGAMIGGLVMGLVESLVSSLSWTTAAGWTLTGSNFRDAMAFAILIAILITKPTGLMGRYEPEKV